MSNRITTGLVALAGLVALVATGPGTRLLPRAGAAATVHLSAKEFAFVPKEVSAPSGEIVFVVKNEGAIEHNFVLEDGAKKKAAEIAVLEPAQALEVGATLKPGVYQIYCTLPGHKDVGMSGTLTVK